MKLRSVMAQARMELILTLRRGESLVVTLAIPAGVLLVASRLEKIGDVKKPLEFVVPGVLALAVIAAAMVNLGIGTGFERRYNVLRRLGSTPLGKGGLVLGKTLSIVALECLQGVILISLAIALGWTPTWHLIPAVLVIGAGTAVFAGLGLLSAGTLRAEANLALLNLGYLIALAISGAALPLSDLPRPAELIARGLPPGALTDSLRGLLQPGKSLAVGSLLALVVWACVLPALAVRLFRWEEK